MSYKIREAVIVYVKKIVLLLLLCDLGAAGEFGEASRCSHWEGARPSCCRRCQNLPCYGETGALCSISKVGSGPQVRKGLVMWAAKADTGPRLPLERWSEREGGSPRPGQGGLERPVTPRWGFRSECGGGGGQRCRSHTPEHTMADPPLWKLGKQVLVAQYTFCICFLSSGPEAFCFFTWLFFSYFWSSFPSGSILATANEIAFLGLEWLVWAKPSTCTSKSVRKEWVLSPMSLWKNPAQATEIHMAVDTLALKGPRHVASGCRPGAGAVFLKSMPVHSVARIRPLRHCFRQQRCISNDMSVGGSSKRDCRLRWLSCPHPRLAASNTKSENGTISRKRIL